MRGSESFRKTVTPLIYLFFQNQEIYHFVLLLFLTFFYFYFQKLKQKAEQDKADELESVNEVLESYGY